MTLLIEMSFVKRVKEKYSLEDTLGDLYRSKNRFKFSSGQHILQYYSFLIRHKQFLYFIFREYKRVRWNHIKTKLTSRYHK